MFERCYINRLAFCKYAKKNVDVYKKGSFCSTKRKKKNTVTTRIDSLDHDLSSDMCSQHLNQGFISEILNKSELRSGEFSCGVRVKSGNHILGDSKLRSDLFLH